MSDPRYEVDVALKAKRPDGPALGFGLFLFEFAPGNAMFWISNGDRRDTSKMLREWLQREGWQ